MFQYSALSPPRLSACLARATNASLQSPHGRGIQVHRYYPGKERDTTTGKASYPVLRREDNELLDVCDDKHRLHLHCLCRSLDLHSLVGPDCSYSFFNSVTCVRIVLTRRKRPGKGIQSRSSITVYWYYNGGQWCLYSRGRKGNCGM